jgi:2-amino-4-hydroxy-6-hydroxymethyldihydropteridine diphosphokinase
VTGDAAERVWYVGLGSNVGDRRAHILEAVRRLSTTRGVHVEAVSSLYESDPWGDTEQDAFLNAAARLRTPLPPLALLAKVKRIEVEIGRQPRRHWGPREIDIDLLLAGDLQVSLPELTIPHPLLAERPFVLVPLAELDATLRLADGSTVGESVTAGTSVRLWERGPFTAK